MLLHSQELWSEKYNLQKSSTYSSPHWFLGSDKLLLQCSAGNLVIKHKTKNKIKKIARVKHTLKEVNVSFKGAHEAIDLFLL